MNWLAHALAAAVALAIADCLVKTAANKVSNGVGLILYGLVPTLLGVIWLAASRERPTNLHSSGTYLALGVGLAFALVTISLYAAFRAGAPVTIVSPLVRLIGLVLASLIGIILWNEQVTIRYVFGLLFACVGVYLITTR